MSLQEGFFRVAGLFYFGAFVYNTFAGHGTVALACVATCVACGAMSEIYEMKAAQKERDRHPYDR